MAAESNASMPMAPATASMTKQAASFILKRPMVKNSAISSSPNSKSPESKLHEPGQDSSNDSQADIINHAVGRIIGGAANSIAEVVPLIESIYSSGAIVVDTTGADKRVIDRKHESKE